MIEVADQVLPVSAEVSDAGVLAIGGVPVTELAREFGTPLYIYDEATLRTNMRRYVNALNANYPDALPLYASKAYSDPHVVKIAAEEGMGLDVVSAGEIAVALAAGFPLERIYFHGNNKLPAELAYALEVGVGTHRGGQFQRDRPAQYHRGRSGQVRANPPAHRSRRRGAHPRLHQDRRARL